MYLLYVAHGAQTNDQRPIVSASQCGNVSPGCVNCFLCHVLAGCVN